MQVQKKWNERKQLAFERKMTTPLGKRRLRGGAAQRRATLECVSIAWPGRTYLICTFSRGQYCMFDVTEFAP